MISDFNWKAVARGGGLVTSGALVSAGVGLLLNGTLARSLGAEQFGRYAVLMATVVLLSTVARFGQGPILIRRISEVEQGGFFTPVFASFAVYGFAVAALVALLVSPLGVIVVSPFGIRASEVGPLIVMVIASGTYLLCIETNRGLRKFGSASFLGLPTQRAIFFLSIGVFAVVSRSDLTLNVAIWLVTVATVLTAVVTGIPLGISLRRQRSRFPSAHEIVQATRAGLPLAVAGIITTAARRIPIWVLALGGSPGQAGVYALAQSFVAMVLLIPTIGNSTLAPFIARTYRDSARTELERRLGIVAGAVAIATAGAVVASIVGGALLIPIVFGSEYLDTLPVLSILLLGVLARTLTGPCGLTLNVTGFQRWTLVASSVSFTMALATVPFLASRYGAVGAAAGVAAAQVVHNGLLLNFARVAAGVRTQAAPLALVRYLRSRYRRA